MKKFFSFSGRERKGMLVLFSMILILLLYLFLLPYFQTIPILINEENVFQKKDKHAMDSLKQHTHSKSIERKKIMIELNQADSSQLIQVKGIGAVFSKRILKYRYLLGGFHHLEQLKEVYGMDEKNWKMIIGQLKLDKNRLKKININEATAFDLSRHPYISKSLASEIIIYRESEGKIHDIKELKDASLIDDQLYIKLAPYLNCRNEP